jgi:hypothetical protein
MGTTTIMGAMNIGGITMGATAIMEAMNIGGIAMGAINIKMETTAIIETTIFDHYYHDDCWIWDLYHILFL